MKTIVINIIMLVLSLNLSGQNLLGYKAGKIEKYIARNHEELVKEENSKNEYFRYLKYTDGTAGTSTIYFFLSENNKCSRIKSMHVHSMKDKVIRKLDKLYTRKGENTWTDRNKGIDAVIKLLNEEWYFTVSYAPVLK